MNGIIKTLVVDDSAFMRKAVTEMLSRNGRIEVVGFARNGAEALDQARQLKPDVVVCDLVMPELDGVAFVREQMRREPLPILILTAAPRDGEQAIEAMNAGAVDIVQKPTARATEEILSVREELVEKVKAAATAPLKRLGQSMVPPPVPQVELPRAVQTGIVVIGISTGGPQALRFLLPQVPAGFPVPMAVVLHMPVGYTALFAQKLNELSAVEVREAAQGEPLRPGTILIAPGGRHLLFKRRPTQRVEVELSATPRTLHRPSADVLFKSAAECYGSGVLGVVMTGMGDDGKQGAAWIKAQGGTVLTEAQESCIIYGMPRSVEEAGLSDASAPLDGMMKAIMQRL